MTRYRLENVIGRGGMAVVYKAERHFPHGLRMSVAVKKILPNRLGDSQVFERFKHEATICLVLSHPNLVKVIDYDIDEQGDLFIVMELVDGGSLDAVASAHPLPMPAVRLILRSMLEAAAYLHSNDLLHRDITPTNILLSANGDVKLADLGLAKILDGRWTSAGFKGTPNYASPEALHDQPLGPSADLYSVAAVGYRLISGEPPCITNLAQTIEHIQAWQSNIPDDLRQIIQGALTYKHERAFHSAWDMIAVLDASGEPISTRAELGQLVNDAMKPDDLADGQPDPEALVATDHQQPPRGEPTRELIAVGSHPAARIEPPPPPIASEDRITAPTQRKPDEPARRAAAHRPDRRRRLAYAGVLLAAISALIWVLSQGNAPGQRDRATQPRDTLQERLTAPSIPGEKPDDEPAPPQPRATIDHASHAPGQPWTRAEHGPRRTARRWAKIPN